MMDTGSIEIDIDDDELRSHFVYENGQARQTSIPVLLNHDPSKVIGVFENGKVRFTAQTTEHKSESHHDHD